MTRAPVQLLASALSCALGLNGCIVMCVGERPIRFRVVDSRTAEPIEGALARRHSYTWLPGMIVLSLARNGTFELGHTSADGSLRVPGLCNTQEHEFTFHKPGYRDAHVRRDSIGGNPNRLYVEVPPENPYGVRVRERQASPQGTVEVLMARDAATTPPPGRH